MISLEVIEIPDIFKKVDNKGPYINFFIDYDKFSEIVLNSINEDYGKLKIKIAK